MDRKLEGDSCIMRLCKILLLVGLWSFFACSAETEKSLEPPPSRNSHGFFRRMMTRRRGLRDVF